MPRLAARRHSLRVSKLHIHNLIEQERQVQLEIAAAAEQLRRIKIEEERRRLQEEAARAKQEEALR
jgi:hypothetical protein